MKRRFWKFALLLLAPLALYAALADGDLWRPKTIVVPNHDYAFVKFSPDGHYLAVWTPDGMNNPQLFLYNVASQQLQLTLNAANPVFLKQGKEMAVISVASSNAYTKIYTVPDGKLISTSPEGFFASAVMADGQTLIDTAGRVPYVRAWNYQKAKDPQSYMSLPKSPPAKSDFDYRRYSLDIFQDGTTALGYIPEPAWFALEKREISRYIGFEFWDIKAKKPRFHINKTVEHTTNTVSAANGICAFGNGAQIEIWNYKTGKQLNSFSATLIDYNSRKVVPQSLSLSPDGSLLAGCGQSPEIGLWDTQTGRQIRILAKPDDAMSGAHWLDFSPDGRTLAGAHNNNTIKLWRIK